LNDMNETNENSFLETLLAVIGVLYSDTWRPRKGLIF
jgi:hypothetical protein